MYTAEQKATMYKSVFEKIVDAAVELDNFIDDAIESDPDKQKKGEDVIYADMVLKQLATIAGNFAINGNKIGPLYSKPAE